ncbi:MAG: ribosomal-processing cysteine protease Prp [Defluviitaleaceae bacterium]|nr:ribosomal-processing cysteine protease Prp [Defluviitaleaceae bacterium]
MISAAITRNENGNVVGFTVENHGDSIVCAAVSMLVLNTVNSIEALTEEDFHCDYKGDGGFLKFTLSNPNVQTEGVKILLDALVLGLYSTQDAYPDELKVM